MVDYWKRLDKSQEAAALDQDDGKQRGLDYIPCEEVGVRSHFGEGTCLKAGGEVEAGRESVLDGFQVWVWEPGPRKCHANEDE